MCSSHSTHVICPERESACLFLTVQGYGAPLQTVSVLLRGEKRSLKTPRVGCTWLVLDSVAGVEVGRQGRCMAALVVLDGRGVGFGRSCSARPLMLPRLYVLFGGLRGAGGGYTEAKLLPAHKSPQGTGTTDPWWQTFLIFVSP